jgi:hypothetical protein
MVLMAVYRRIAGGDPMSGGTSKTIKRKPSGAELSAWIGHVTQASLGLSDAKRTVRARAVM